MIVASAQVGVKVNSDKVGRIIPVDGNRHREDVKQASGLILTLVTGILAMSSASILIRWTQAEHVPSLVIAAYRLTAATLALSIPAALQQVWRDYAKLDMGEVGMLLSSGILLGLHFATWITSLQHTSVVSSVVLVTTTPLWIGLASPLVLKEPTPRVTWLGIALAIIGGSIIGLSGWAGWGGTTWGNLLALAGAVFGAGYLMIGRGARARLRLIAYLWLVYGVAAVLLLGWAIAAGLPLVGYSPRAVGLMITLGLVPQLIGHSAANYALRHLSATFVGVTILGEPIGSTLLAALLLDEWPTGLQIAGGGLILAGILLASLAEERDRAKASAVLESTK